MARKGQVSIQDTVETNEEFEEFLVAHAAQLICMEVYSDFCGNCLATGNAIRKGKLEIGGDSIAMVKACADNIDALVRFKNKSEPTFLFIVKGKLTRAMFGANGIELCRIMVDELELMKQEHEIITQGIELETPLRPKYEITDMLPEESAKLEEDLRLEEEYKEAANRLQVLTLAARKRRVCDRMSRNMRRLNWIMFWPHCHQAYYDLYEKWDLINIQVGAKETVQLTEDTAKEALYMSDVDPNEACIHMLLSGEVMVVLFKMFDTDNRDFVQLLRYTLYEEIPVPKEDTPPEKQVPPIPAYERYATISKTAREVRRDRYNAKLKKLQEEQEERDRLAAEQARLARQAEEERIAEEKRRKEEEIMARLQAGLPPEPEPEPEPEVPEQAEGEGEMVEGEMVEGEVVEGEELREKVEGEAPISEPTETDANEEAPNPEELVEEKVEAEEEFNSDIEVEGEDYIPPGGLFVPGLYSPLNELSKANGLTLFFPNTVIKLTPIESEYLPPHVLVMFTVDKRQDVLELAKQYADEILAIGIFVGETISQMEHIAYSIKQYNNMERLRKHRDRLALMVSRKRSLPLLMLAGLNPCYISSDVESGERDCLQLFPVGYGDDFEDEPSVVEEEIVEAPPPVPVEENAEPEEVAVEETGDPAEDEEEG